MHNLAILCVHEPPNFWVRLGAFNLALAIILGALFGIALRSVLLLALDRNSSRGIAALRILKGGAFMLLGWLYALVAWPMLAWDRPARALAAITIVLPPVVAGIRHATGRDSRMPKAVSGIVSAFLMVVLLLAAMVTLLRSGFITLKSDRVPLMIEVTGETRTEPVNPAPADGAARSGQETAHRVILWLQDGTRGADAWVTGDRVALNGRAVLFSKRLNKIGVPNLYEFVNIHNGLAGSEAGSPSFSMPFPHSGPLAIRPGWRSIQERILDTWQATTANGSLWALRTVNNQSPYYPLAGPDGQPVAKRFLLDLTLEGTPTSRGSSPLESR